jgi:hypothetical protein
MDPLATNVTEFSSQQKRLEGKTYGAGTYEGRPTIAGSTR